MIFPVSLYVEIEDVGLTQEVTFLVNGSPIVSYRPGTKYLATAAEDATEKLVNVFGRLLKEEISNDSGSRLP